MLGVAVALASRVHEKQKDKAGKPYILHPLGVMMRLRSEDSELNQIAVLHDVVEDGGTTYKSLLEMGFSEAVVNTLALLTHDRGISYEDYIERMRGNYYALVVKREDLRDNSDITRLKGVTDKDVVRMRKYHLAFSRVREMLAEFDAKRKG
jgi:(p)ppGpp synthase/HD superfamily hydrolase